MNDRLFSVSVWTVAATAAWITTFLATVYAGVATDWTWLPGPASAVAATLSIRCFCVRLGRNIQQAFDYGRDIGHGEVSQIRR